MTTASKPGAALDAMIARWATACIEMSVAFRELLRRLPITWDVP